MVLNKNVTTNHIKKYITQLEGICKYSDSELNMILSFLKDGYKLSPIETSIITDLNSMIKTSNLPVWF